MARQRFDDLVAEGARISRYLKLQADTVTLGGNATLLDDDGVIWAADAGGSSRNVTLPARAATNDGQVRYIINLSTAGENLVIKNSGGTTLLTLPSGGVAMVIATGTDEAPGTRAWKAVPIGGEDLTLADDLTVTGDASITGTLAVTGAATMGQVASRKPIIADGAAVVLTAADSGGLVVMDKTDGSQTTLPEITASNIGMWFEFQWPASYASGTQKIITGNAADFIVGTISKFDTDTLTDPLSVESFNGSSHIAVVIDAVTDGGLLGSWLRFTAISATQWLIQGMLHHSGNVSASASTT